MLKAEPTTDESPERKGKSKDRKQDSAASLAEEKASGLVHDREIFTNFSSQLKNHRLSFRRRCKTLISKTLCQVIF